MYIYPLNIIIQLRIKFLQKNKINLSAMITSDFNNHTSNTDRGSYQQIGRLLFAIAKSHPPLP